MKLNQNAIIMIQSLAIQSLTVTRNIRIKTKVENELQVLPMFNAKCYA